MKHYFKNPRAITKKEFSDLRDSLRKFGDLGVIVHNLRTDEIISGNQRMEVFDLSKCKIDITEKFDPPTKTGTVAVGWLWWEDERFTYRAVDWDERQAEEANIRANKSGGAWDFDILANQWETSDLLQWGFQGYELGIPGGIDPNDEWKGMPEYGDEAKALKTIHIHFENEQDIRDFEEKYNFIIGDKVTFWFPPRKNKDLKSMAIINES